MKKALLTCIALLVIAPFAAGQAQTYPTKPVRVVVPFTPGGGSDTAARFFGQKLAEMLGQPFLVENKPGGVSGAIGTTLVKTAPADGYTILVGSSSPMIVNAITVKTPGYDPIKDFKPLAGLTKNTTAIVVPVDSKLHTIADLVATSKKVPMLNAGTASAGFQLAANWLGNVADFKFTHVPYKGLGPVLTDLGGGHLDWAIVDLAGAMPLLQSGKIRALAVTDEKRHPSFPDVPTVAESGYPEYVYNTWTSFHVRTETPTDITNKLATALQKILATDAAKEYVRKSGTELLPLDPIAMLKFQQVELDRFQRVADATGIKKE